MVGYKPSINRREFIKSSVAGVGTGSLMESNVAEGSKDSIRIVTARDEDGPIDTKRVPKSWYRQIKKARSLSDKVREKYKTKSGVNDVRIGTSDETFGKRLGHSIVIAVDETGVDASLPDSVEDIPVQVTEERSKSHHLTCDNLGEYDEIPGGVSHGYDFATTCVKVRDIEPEPNQPRLLTAAHVHGSCGTDLSGKTFHQEDPDGSIQRYNWDSDFALVEDTYSDGQSFDDKILEQDGSRIDIDGWYTKNGISDLMSTNEQVKKMGKTSGNTSGEIEYMETAGDPRDCHDYGFEGVRLTNNGGKGDSGGPIYNMVGEEARMIAMISQGTGNVVNNIDCDMNGISSPIFEKIEGPTFYHMWNKFSFFPKS